MVGDRLAVGVEQLSTLLALFVGHPDARSVAGQIDRCDTGGSHLVVVGIRFGVLAHVAALPHASSQTEIAQALADLEAVGARLKQDDVLRCQLGSGPFQQGLQREVFPATDLARVVRGMPHEDGRREGVRMAVQADNFSFVRRRGSQRGEPI